jgi:hypothetical protein
MANLSPLSPLRQSQCAARAIATMGVQLAWRLELESIRASFPHGATRREALKLANAAMCERMAIVRRDYWAAVNAATRAAIMGRYA